MTYSVWGSFGSNIPTRDVFATETFVTLRALTPPRSDLNVTIDVDGGVSKGDGLGGTFYYDPNSVLADDAVSVIAPTPIPAIGRWRRSVANIGFSVVVGGIIFGAAGNTFAQDAALTWDNVNKRLVTPVLQSPSGTLKVVGTNGLDLQYTDNTHVVGGGALTLGTTGLSSGYIISRENLYIMPNVTGGTLSGTLNITDKDLNSKFSVNTVSGVVTIPGSVVTPLVTTLGATLLGLGVNGNSKWGIDPTTFNLYPTDITAPLGKTTNVIPIAFISVIDSGIAAQLLLKTNNGTIQVQIPHIASAVNFIAAQGAATGGNVAVGAAFASADTDVQMVLYSKGAGTINLGTNAGNSTQLQVLHTASATQNPTITGGNGVNSKIGTTAGGLDLTSATIRFTGIGTTAVAANATLNAVGSNDLLRSTSSRRYKKDWIDLEDEDLSILDNIRTIKYKSSSEQDDPNLIHYGMLAEDVFKLNKNLVTFNKINVGFNLDVPDWVQYERFIPLLIEQRRRDLKRIEALEAKLGIH